MNIAFVVSSAEPGRDGMGDYTLSLARGLRENGHNVLVIALNDRWLPAPAAARSEETDEGVCVERLPAYLPWKVRIQRASARLQVFRPDWMSFQLVNYGYNPKGVLFAFNRRLRAIAGLCENWQVMFQELWIGLERRSPWKHRLVGPLQKRSIIGLVRTLRPKLLQTSTPFFRAALGKLGLNASVLPLAGSIPVNPDPGADWFRSKCIGLPSGADTQRGDLTGGFFGSIYEKWEPEPFFSVLRSVSLETRQKVCILSCGRLAAGEALWENLASSYPDFSFVKLGELPPERVSQYLQNLDFGIAASPWLLIGKSSATAAMLDHGVPVMVTRNDAHPCESLSIEAPADPLLILADGDVSAHFRNGLPRRAPRNSVEGLALEFVHQMELSQSSNRVFGALRS